MWRGISLANKCLLLFGAAVVLIIVAALAVPWLRMNAIVDESQHEMSRRLVAWWESSAADQIRGAVAGDGLQTQIGRSDLSVLTRSQIDSRAESDRFVREAQRAFARDPDRIDYDSASWTGTARTYRYARRVQAEDGATLGMIVLSRRSPGAAGQLLVNTAYLLSAGSIALGLAVLVFYLITNKLILGPVRSLKETAELVREGNLNTRSEISTGDEFEDLSETFNQMLEALTTSQNQLRAINASLDLKLNELAERNVALFESNKLKGEFLANVSHELRTPLHSIIGFSELLIEIADKEMDAGDDSTRLAKRHRYLDNILSSSRSLLGMINGLLEMAKLEAGRLELHVEPMSVGDACEALLALIRPVADRGGVELVLEAAPDLPVVHTDVKKFQQVVFNLLSNAVKFTAGSNDGRPSRVTLRAEVLVGRAGEGPEAHDRLRVSVLDTGPGIAREDLDRIFEKFHQLDAGHTRRHEGTGLGLAISRELASVLQGEIQVESEVGSGSMFSLILPMSIDGERVEEMRLEMAFRGSLSGRSGPA